MSAFGSFNPATVRRLESRIAKLIGRPRFTSGASSSASAGTVVASLTANPGRKFVEWNCDASQVATANTQYTLTITYADGSTISASTTSGRNEQLHADASGIMNETTVTSVVAGLDKDVVKIEVVTLGTGATARTAKIKAIEVDIAGAYQP